MLALKGLNDEEITIECIVRGIDKVTNPNWYETLVDLLRRESTDPSLKPNKTHVSDFNLELKTCREHFDNFSKTLQNVDIQRDPDQLNTLRNRICHWENRTSRLKGCFHQNNDVEALLKIWRRTRLLVDKYIDLVLNLDPDPSTGLANPTTQIPDSKSMTEPPPLTPLQPVGFTTSAPPIQIPTDVPQQPNPNSIFMSPPTNPTQAPSYMQMPFVPSYLPFFLNSPNAYNTNLRNKVQWNIKFSGSSQGLNIKDFLFRLEAYAEMDGIPTSELHTILPKLLNDVAEKWYWVFRKKNPQATYSQLKEALIYEFSDSESDRQLRKIIQTRLQKNKEMFSEYLLEMETLNSRLTSPFTQFELLDIVRNNMDPALQNVTLTSQFHSTEHLSQTCRKFERLWLRTGHDPRLLVDGRTAKRPTINELNIATSKIDVEDGKIGENPDDDHFLEAMKIPTKTTPFNRNSKQQSDTYLICWNCKDLGHRYQDCTLPPQGIFCYGCGRERILKPQCLYCTKTILSGNTSMAVNESGVSRPARILQNPKTTSTNTTTSPNNS